MLDALAVKSAWSRPRYSQGPTRLKEYRTTVELQAQLETRSRARPIRVTHAFLDTVGEHAEPCG